MERKGIVVVVSGFSGAGKGTLMKRLVSDHDCYALSISMTTRDPRPGEENGREYFFVEREEFEHQIKNKGLIEYTCYCDNYYGTPKKYIEEQLEAGRDVILEIEVEGALQIREHFKDALLLFVTPPSIEELKRRLCSRQTESEEQIQKRLTRAVEEAKSMDVYDYIIINDDLEEALKVLHNTISSAHLTPGRSRSFIEEIAKELKAL